MSQLQTISQIAFESGTVLTIEQLPPEFQAEVLQYNAWTIDAQRLEEEIAAWTKQLTMLSYARSASFSAIQQLANDLEKTVETHTPVINPPAPQPVEEDGA